MNKTVRANIIDLSIHLILAAVISFFIFEYSSNFKYIAIFLCGTLLIDLDHLLDYFFACGLHFSLRGFFGNIHLKSGKVYLLLHSWELVALIFVFGFSLSQNYALFLSFGMAVHLIVDNLKRTNKLFYFLTYRIIKKFNVDELLPEAGRL